MMGLAPDKTGTDFQPSAYYRSQPCSPFAVKYVSATNKHVAVYKRYGQPCLERHYCKVRIRLYGEHDFLRERCESHAPYFCFSLSPDIYMYLT